MRVRFASQQGKHTPPHLASKEINTKLKGDVSFPLHARKEGNVQDDPDRGLQVNPCSGLAPIQSGKADEKLVPPGTPTLPYTLARFKPSRAPSKKIYNMLTEEKVPEVVGAHT